MTTPAFAVDAQPVAGLDPFRPLPVPTTAGSPYSRATMAAWHMIPPISSTAAAILPKTGVQLVDVEGATRTSPCLEFVELVRIGDHARRALGHAGRTGTPDSVPPPRRDGAQATRDPLGRDAEEHRRHGIGDPSGTGPRAGGAGHSRIASWIALRRATIGGQCWAPYAATPPELQNDPKLLQRRANLVMAQVEDVVSRRPGIRAGPAGIRTPAPCSRKP